MHQAKQIERRRARPQAIVETAKHLITYLKNRIHLSASIEGKFEAALWSLGHAYNERESLSMTHYPITN